MVNFKGFSFYYTLLGEDRPLNPKECDVFVNDRLSISEVFYNNKWIPMNDYLKNKE